MLHTMTMIALLPNSPHSFAASSLCHPIVLSASAFGGQQIITNGVRRSHNTNKTHVLANPRGDPHHTTAATTMTPTATAAAVLTDDYYDILGVATDASTDDIRAAYQRLALAHHPDKQLQQAASAVTDTRAFIRITEAWNTLRDAELRRVYDAERFQGRIDDVPLVHQVLLADEVQRTADGCGLAYTCRCGAVCRVDTHNRLDGDAWRFNTCDECSHAVEMEVEL